jgi:hypothetical protein
MKSQRKNQEEGEGTRAAEFGAWFASIAERLAANVEDPALLRELDRRIRSLHDEFSWEVGPGKDTDWRLCVSPSLNPKLYEQTKQLVAAMPKVPHWEFFPARQPKEWSGRFQVNTAKNETLEIDASGWRYVLLRYPDGGHEILLQGSGVACLSDEERWHAAAIVLESLLGEETLLTKNVSFELAESLEPKFAVKAKPIQALDQAFR